MNPKKLEHDEKYEWTYFDSGLSLVITPFLYCSHILGENLMSLSLSEIQKIETKLDAGLTKIRNKKVRASLIQAMYDFIFLIPAMMTLISSN
mgnify:CR=1 FL=1